ncbi:hypothetical protein F5Y17DRAFT_386824 [Xylariaceae sp. FL0594]|nr:hypothetical protein F5Y17DRAFT_386824 [Xylariaceae sp. FL0594]
MPFISGAKRNRERGSNPSAHSTPNPRRRRQAEAVEMPEYEPPSCPMDAAARKALSELSTNNSDLRKYEEQLKTSLELLTSTVRDINDRYSTRKSDIQSSRCGRSGTEEEEEYFQVEGGDEIRKEIRHIDDEALAVLRDAVPSLSAECEKAVRDVIDLRVEVEDGRMALRETVKKVEFESANAALRNREANRQEDEEEDEEGGNANNADPDVIGPLRILKKEKEKAATDYATKSLEERYAVDNDYIGFKRLWWDATHSGASDKPLPDPSRWFKNNNEGEEEEDEEVVVAEEHISIYCPLSMVVMKEPYTSKVCKHTFNKPAIVQFLRSQPECKATCPLTGCDKVVTIGDFYDDQVMLRRIKRAQAENERRNDEDEGDIDVEGDSTIVQERNHKSAGGRDKGDQLLGGLGLGQAGEDEDEE